MIVTLLKIVKLKGQAALISIRNNDSKSNKGEYCFHEQWNSKLKLVALFNETYALDFWKENL